MKKKLLLVGVAAMGLLAVGVGATSTFAWFTASNAVTVGASTSNTGTLNTQATEVTIEEVSVTLAITGSANNVELTYINPSDNHVLIGAYSNGNFATNDWTAGIGADDAAKTAWRNSHRIVESFTITASASPTPAQLSALVNKKVTIPAANFIALGNAVLVGDNGVAAGTQTADILFDETTGAIVSDVTESNCKYAIRTNNPVGLEVPDFSIEALYAAGTYVFHDDTATPDGKCETLYVVKSGGHAAGAWNTSEFDAVVATPAASLPKGTFVKSGNDYYVAVNASGTSGSDVTVKTDFAKVVSHSFDGISIEATGLTTSPR